MFFCNECANKKGWPQSFSRSRGRCEVCGEIADCNEVPSSELPIPIKKYKAKVILEMDVYGNKEYIEGDIKSRFKCIPDCQMNNTKMIVTNTSIELGD